MGTLAWWFDMLVPGTTAAGDAAARAAGFTPDAAGAYCPRCGASGSPASFTVSGCAHCRGVRVPWHGVWRIGAYREPLNQWIIQYKFRGQWAWCKWFGQQLAASAARMQHADGPAVVTAVPLHWRRRILRGYDQSHLIAEHFARSMNLPAAHLLRRRSATRPQYGISNKQHRWENVRRAFVMRNVALTGCTVWLIDDIKTTGSTARACIRLLRRAGAQRVNLIVAAVADPNHADFQRN